MISAMSSSECLIWVGVRATGDESFVAESTRVVGTLRRIRNLSRAVFQPFEEFIENSCKGLRFCSSNGAALMADEGLGSRLAVPKFDSRVCWTVARGSNWVWSRRCFSENLSRGKALAGRGAFRSSCESSGLYGMSAISFSRCVRISLTFLTRLRNMTARHPARSSDHSLRAYVSWKSTNGEFRKKKRQDKDHFTYFSVWRSCHFHSGLNTTLRTYEKNSQWILLTK